MTKKLFALASVTALTGVVAAGTAAGCSSTTITDNDSGTGSSGEAGKAETGKTETGTSSGEEAGPSTCPTPDVIDATTFPWKPPSVTPGACTEGELDAFVAFVEKTDDPQKWKDGNWTTNAACRDCVFAKETTTWPPLILNASGQLAELNVGGCIAIASGKEACGKAYQQWRTCYLEACTDCPDGDSNAFSKCVTAANKKACKKAFDDVVPACGDVDTAANAETACDGEKYVFEGPIRAQCIGLVEGGG
jgi:hypothetical protein